MIEIIYKYSTETKVPVEEIDHFQKNLKDLSQENFNKLEKEILETGFAFAPHCWKDPSDGRYKLLDGHQRLRVLRSLKEKGKHIVPPVPIIVVEASDIKEARRRVLQGTSQYGEMTEQGLEEFSIDADLSISEIKLNFRLPEINFKYFDDDIVIPADMPLSDEIGMENDYIVLLFNSKDKLEIAYKQFHLDRVYFDLSPTEKGKGYRRIGQGRVKFADEFF